MIDTNSVNHPSGDTALMLVTEALMSELGRRTAPESTKNIEKIEQALNDNGLLGLCGPAQSVFHQKDFRQVERLCLLCLLWRGTWVEA